MIHEYEVHSFPFWRWFGRGWVERRVERLRRQGWYDVYCYKSDEGWVIMKQGAPGTWGQRR